MVLIGLISIYCLGQGGGGGGNGGSSNPSNGVGGNNLRLSNVQIDSDTGGVGGSDNTITVTVELDCDNEDDDNDQSICATDDGQNPVCMSKSIKHGSLLSGCGIKQAWTSTVVYANIKTEV